MKETEKKNSIHINFLGTSGSGKTTCACKLFCTLKVLGYNVEFTREYPAECCVRGEFHKLYDQVGVLAEQYARFKMYDGKFDIIVNDYSLILPIVYAELQDRASTQKDGFKQLCLDKANEFNHINIFMNSDRNEQKDSSRNNDATYNDKINDKTIEVIKRNNIKTAKYTWKEFEKMLVKLPKNDIKNLIKTIEKEGE